MISEILKGMSFEELAEQFKEAIPVLVEKIKDHKTKENISNLATCLSEIFESESKKDPAKNAQTELAL